MLIRHTPTHRPPPRPRNFPPFLFHLFTFCIRGEGRKQFAHASNTVGKTLRDSHLSHVWIFCVAIFPFPRFYFQKSARLIVSVSKSPLIASRRTCKGCNVKINQCRKNSQRTTTFLDATLSHPHASITMCDAVTLLHLEIPPRRRRGNTFPSSFICCSFISSQPSNHSFHLGLLHLPSMFYHFEKKSLSPDRNMFVMWMVLFEKPCVPHEKKLTKKKSQVRHWN